MWYLNRSLWLQWLITSFMKMKINQIRFWIFVFFAPGWMWPPADLQFSSSWLNVVWADDLKTSRSRTPVQVQVQVQRITVIFNTCLSCWWKLQRQAGLLCLSAKERIDMMLCPSVSPWEWTSTSSGTLSSNDWKKQNCIKPYRVSIAFTYHLISVDCT